MEKKRIIERMKQLADLIHYEPGDISHLANAMCVNVLNNGNTSNKSTPTVRLQLWVTQFENDHHGETASKGRTEGTSRLTTRV